MADGIDSITLLHREQLLGWGMPQEIVDDPTSCRRAGSSGTRTASTAGLFSYSPQDSALMDPQQRILLECAWSALEHAGIPAGRAGRQPDGGVRAARA